MFRLGGGIWAKGCQPGAHKVEAWTELGRVKQVGEEGEKSPPD